VSPGTTTPSAGEVRGAIGHQLMGLADRRALECFFPSSRGDREMAFLGHASPWALHVTHDGWLEVGVFADGVMHWVALFSALIKAAEGRIGNHRGLALGPFEHQQHLVDGLWTAGLPAVNGAWLLPALPAYAPQLLLLSPLRLRREGRDVGARDLSFRDIAASLMRRSSALLRQAGLELPPWQARALLEAVPVPGFVEADWARESVARYSQRQEQAMRLNGVRGSGRVDTAALTPLWPLLWMGQVLQVGKTTCLGMGRYVLEE